MDTYEIYLDGENTGLCVCYDEQIYVSMLVEDLKAKNRTGYIVLVKQQKPEERKRDTRASSYF